MTLDAGLDQPLRVVNVGLELFAEQIEAQGAAVDRVDWRPPAGGPDIASLSRGWRTSWTWGRRHGPQPPKRSERPGGAVALLFNPTVS